MHIEERLDRLEKQNQNLRRGLVSLLLLVLVVPLAAFVWQDKQPKVGRFDVIEANSVRAKTLFATRLDMMKGEKGIMIYAGEMCGISLGNKDRSLMLAVFPDMGAQKQKAGLFINDVKGGEASVSASRFGASLRLLDAGESLRARLGYRSGVNKKTGAKTGKSASTLTLYDDKGKVIHQVPK